MNEIEKSNKNDFLSIIHGTGNLDLVKPFERDIFLFETHVAGTTHVEGILDLEPYLKIDERLEFYREPDNYYDEKAIVIKTINGVKIGYIPKADNIIFSRLMDAGKLLFGKIKEKEIVNDNWLKITINIYLSE